MIVFVILLRVFSEKVVVAETSYQMFRRFIIMRSGEGLTDFNKIILLTLVNKSTMKLSGLCVFF